MTEKIIDITGSYFVDNDILVMLWEREAGWQVVNSGCSLIDEKYYINDGLAGLKSIVSEKEIIGYERLINDLRECVKGASDSIPQSKRNLTFSFSMMTVKGYYSDFKITLYLKFDKNECLTAILCRVEELDPEESYRYQLAKVITNDKNPESFNREVAKLFEQNPNKDYALIQFDIAGFKLINQQYGERVGDEILEYIINTLKYVCSDQQIFVRLTADVFMIVTPYSEKNELLDFIENIRDLLQGYKDIEYRLVFGINFVKDKTKNLRKYGDGAAFARQSIKNNALKYVAFFEDNMEKSANNKKWVEDQMEKALNKHEFEMYLQPKFSISSEEVVGAEALVRWMHPEKGMIPPMDFIPLFEKNGFVVKLDRYMWEEACKCLANWKKEGKKIIPISVNVSRRHMQDDSYLEYLEGLLKKYDLEKKYLEIEITETLDDIAVSRGIEELKHRGFTLLMDDFGTGYSSLNMLKDTQFDVIKIDRGFLNNFIESDRGKAIVRHTITMTHDIGLDIVAEGVETIEQARFLNECGCEIAQGYYYAKPMPLSDFNEKYASCI